MRRQARDPPQDHWKWVARESPPWSSRRWVLVPPPQGSASPGLDLAPVGIARGALAILMAKGGGGGSELLAACGFSIIPLSVAMLPRTPGTAASSGRCRRLPRGLLAAPFNMAEKILGVEREGDIEDVLLAGIMVVISFTTDHHVNARLLTTLFQQRREAVRCPAILTGATAACVGCRSSSRDNADGPANFYLFDGLLALVAANVFAAARFSHLAPALKRASPIRWPTGPHRHDIACSRSSSSHRHLQCWNANLPPRRRQRRRGGWDVVPNSNRNNPSSSAAASRRRERFD